MARQVQIIKGTTEQNDAFTGAEGVLTYDTETKNLRIHDGTTEGGFEIPSSAMGDYVIYWDSADSTDHSHAKPGVSTPTDHGWYRYYKSGWVEQGGKVSVSQTSPQIVVDTPLIIPLNSNAAQIPLASYTYTSGQSMVVVSISCTENNFHAVVESVVSQSAANSGIISWSVSGQAA